MYLVCVATILKQTSDLTEGESIEFPLDDYISIMIHQTDLNLTQLIKQKLAPLELSPEQNLIMMLLWRQDGLSQNQIAIALNKDKTNIARMLLCLEQKGFIQRFSCPDDRRSLHVYLMENGKKLKDPSMKIAEEFTRQITEGITEQELQNLRCILTKIRENAKNIN